MSTVWRAVAVGAVAALGCGTGDGSAGTVDASGADAAVERVGDGGIDAPSGANDVSAGLEAGAGESSVDLPPLADGAAADGGGKDAGGADTGADARPGAACAQPSQCEALGRPPVGRWCGSSAWSCLDGRCVWECEGGRTCARDAAGCLSCNGVPGRSCPTDPCRVPHKPGEVVESMTCATSPPRATWSCFGAWVVLPDGELCSLEFLPTGALRFAVNCGACQTVLRQ